MADDDMDRASGRLNQLLGYQLRRAAAAVLGDFAEAMADMDVKPAHFSTLVTIEEAGEIHQSDIGRRIGVQRANMVALVNELEGRGWIARRAATSGRRAWLYALTPAGQAAIAALHTRIAAHEAPFKARLDDVERTIADLHRLWR